MSNFNRNVDSALEQIDAIITPKRQRLHYMFDSVIKWTQISPRLRNQGARKISRVQRMIEKRNAVNRTPVIEKTEIVPRQSRSPEPEPVLSPISCGSGTDSDVGYQTSNEPIFSPPQIKKQSDSKRIEEDTNEEEEANIPEFQRKFQEILYNPRKYEENTTKYFDMPILEGNEDISDIDENSSSLHSSRLDSDGSESVVSMLSDASTSDDDHLSSNELEHRFRTCRFDSFKP